MEKDINKTQEKTQANKKQEGYLKIGGSGSFNFYWIYIIIAATLFGIYFMSSNELSREISYSDFQTMAKNGYFERMILNKKQGMVSAPLNSAPTEESFHAIKSAYEAAPCRRKS